MSDRLELGWLDEFQRAVNDDPEMGIIGQWFTTTFSIDFGADRVAFRVVAGRIEAIIREPRFDVRAAFGFSAPPAIWRKHFAPTPPPLYHDVFPMMMREPAFELQGDGLVAMQHARALHRTLTLMRETGAGHA